MRGVIYSVVEVFLADAWKSAGPRGSWTRERMGKTGTSEMEEMSEVEEIDREKREEIKTKETRETRLVKMIILRA